MYKGLEYMRQVTVASVGAGGIVDENGRSLVCVGNLPIKPGDKVWTDGRIIYGHVPVRQNINLGDKIMGLPYMFFSGNYNNMLLTPQGKDLKRMSRNVTKLPCMNWLYAGQNAIYSGTSGSPGLKDFLDIKVTNNAVYTAEYLPEDAPFYGENATGYPSGINRTLVFIAHNYYLHCDSNAKTSPSFSLGWLTTDLTRLQANPIIAIKRNGGVVQQINLGDYSDFVMQTLQDVYLQYDEYDEDDTEKEIYYHCDAKIDGRKYQDMDIYCAYTGVQCLNFTFIDDVGNWEMTLCTVGDGRVFPHTSDKERAYDEETGESKIIDVWSFFNIAVPVIYYVIRVDSRGKKSVLQRELVVKPLQQNGFTGKSENFHSSWENARAIEVEEVNESEKPAFWVNYGDCALKTDLINIQSIVNNNGTLLSNVRLIASQALTLSDAAEATSWGSTNKYITIHLTTGQITKADSRSIDGYSTGVKLGPNHSITQGQIVPTTNASLYFGRLSIHKFADNDYMIALRWQSLWRVTDGHVMEYRSNGAPINVNQDIVNLRRAMKKPKTITDLIANVTAGKLAKNNQQGG